MIDIDGVFIKFQKIIAERAGSYLSKIRGTEIPSVIRARDASNIPDYPYVTVDVQSLGEEEGWEQDEYLDDDGNFVYEVPKQLVVAVRCYGGTTSSQNNALAFNICNVIQGALMFDYVRIDLKRTLNAGIISVTPIENIPVKRTDTFVEMSYFYITVSMVDTHTDTLTSALITEVGYEGLVLQDPDDETPVDASFTVTND